MAYVKKVLARGMQEIKNAVYSLRVATGELKTRVEYDVPYICQFAVPESAEVTLKKQLLLSDDPCWKESGASTAERYAFFATNICGVVSAAMAIAFFKGEVAKPVALAEDALLAGVYRETETDLTDMRYREFASWIQKFGLCAHVYTRLSLKGIQYALSRGELVMASVNPNIRGYATSPEDKVGGHIVLVTGYDKSMGNVIINNPSGFLSLKTQKGHVLSEDQFLRYFAGRGIALSATPAK